MFENVKVQYLQLGDQYTVENTYGYDFFDRAHIRVFGLSSSDYVHVIFECDEYAQESDLALFQFSVLALYTDDLNINCNLSFGDLTLEELLKYSCKLLDNYYELPSDSSLIEGYSLSLMTIGE